MAKSLDRQIFDALGELHDQVDEDCPAEYRTKHLRAAMETARDLCKRYARRHARRGGRKVKNGEEE